MSINQRLRKIGCTIRGSHLTRCEKIEYADLMLTTHTHTCQRCDTRTLAEITLLEATRPWTRTMADMGMAPEDQSTFLN